MDAVLVRLKTNSGALEIWTERFRMWMASTVLQPLVLAMDNAAANVVSATQAIGVQAFHLAELGGPSASGELVSGHGPQA